MDTVINTLMKGIASGIGLVLLALVLFFVHKIRLKYDKHTTIGETAIKFIGLLLALFFIYEFSTYAWVHYF